MICRGLQCPSLYLQLFFFPHQNGLLASFLHSIRVSVAPDTRLECLALLWTLLFERVEQFTSLSTPRAFSLSAQNREERNITWLVAKFKWNSKQICVMCVCCFALFSMLCAIVCTHQAGLTQAEQINLPLLSLYQREEYYIRRNLQDPNLNTIFIKNIELYAQVIGSLKIERSIT